MTGARAFGYLRVSTEGQGADGFGIQAQTDAVTACCLRLGIPLHQTFTDVITGSATLEQRPALADALSNLRSGDILVVAKLDRLARDSFTSLVIEREVKRRGASIVSCAGEGNGDDPAATFTRRILAAVAELERSLIAARTRAALQAAKARGRRVGHLPWGWKLADDGVHLEQNADEAQVLERMRFLRVRGHAIHSIAETLTSEGRLNRAGQPFKVGHIAQLLERHGEHA
jgi:DNA invertase Pin-like site-specific DNA recombinase